ncbi:FAD:protein FMN transferase [Yinghuangia seranimata]|uniref:FAD:protein FMN transferase n=1 Tax=Yinghuangia seranimata TaxID=408067 RepID=UPI00248BA5CA|nr:FAD:protein FMN transferase [Yinghuangia seranimata]MDI2124822.1 FAD:protein FMN transferase [Yinghuangia seranimata]
MGTVFSFDVRDRATDRIRAAVREGVAWLHHVDAEFSTYRADSRVSRIRRGELAVADAGPEVAEVLGLCADVAEVSGGCFSLTYAGALDPTALVKGWAIEHASRLLADAGATNTCVNGGGDLRARGESAPGRPWRVGIADPLRAGRLATVAVGGDFAVGTSGTAERGHHIVDPRTGRPALDLASLTVTGPSLTLADAYATAAFVMGPAARGWIETLDGFEAFAVLPGGRTWETTGFSRAAGTARVGRKAP